MGLDQKSLRCAIDIEDVVPPQFPRRGVQEGKHLEVFGIFVDQMETNTWTQMETAEVARDQFESKLEGLVDFWEVETEIW